MNIAVYFVELTSCLGFLRSINLSRNKSGPAKTTLSAAALGRSNNSRPFQRNQYRFVCASRYGFRQSVSGNHRQIEDLVLVLPDKLLIASRKLILSIGIKSDTSFGQIKLIRNAFHVIIHPL